MPFQGAFVGGAESLAELRGALLRRFIDPIFLGTAIIVPPVKPADVHASLDVVRQAAEAVERAEFSPDGISAQQAQGLATAVLEWANR